MKRLLSVVTVCLTMHLVCWTNDAQAQWGGGMGGGRRGGMGQARSGGEVKSEAEKPFQTSNSSDQILMRLDGLHAELQLTPTQEPLWMQFADKFNRYLDFLVREKMSQVPFDPTISTTVYVSRVVDSARNRYTLLEDLEEKTKQMYSNLSPPQKLQFDTKIQSIVIKEIGR